VCETVFQMKYQNLIFMLSLSSRSLSCTGDLVYFIFNKNRLITFRTYKNFENKIKFDLRVSILLNLTVLKPKRSLEIEREKKVQNFHIIFVEITKRVFQFSIRDFSNFIYFQ
jgi:hypothetical protein